MICGNIFKVSKDTFRYRYMIQGVNYSRDFKASSLKEAKQIAQNYVYEINNYKDSMSFETLVNSYITNYYEINFTPQTVKSTRTAINNMLMPFFKSYTIEAITPEVVNKFVNKLKVTKATNKDTLLKPKSIKNYYDNLKAILNYAVRMEYIDKNPCNKIQLNLRVQKYNEIHFYDEEQVKKLLEAMKDENINIQIAIMFALFCGMRKSEIYGLIWSDIKGSTISIKRSNVKNKVGQTKTATSERTLTLPKVILDSLASLSKVNESDFILPYNDDIARQLHRIQKSADLPIIRFHDLRHTSATLLLKNGIDIKTISEFLGHSNIATTSIYLHSLDKNFSEVSSKLSSVLDKS